MRRLLAINNYHYRRGGADVVFLEQLKLFQAAGWATAPFAMSHPRNEDTEWSRYFADEIELGTSYGPLKTARNAVRIVHNSNASRNLKAQIDAFRPDLVHAHNVYHHLSPSVLATARRAGLPVFLTLHDLKLMCPAYTMLAGGKICEACRPDQLRHVIGKRCMKGSLALSALIYVESTVHRLLHAYDRYVDRFVVPSRFLVQKFVEWGWREDRFAYVPNFIDASVHAPQYEAGRPFVFVGRLSAEKGLLTLIRAAAHAAVPLRLIGTGPQAAELQAAAAESGAEVEFLGYQSGDALWNALRAARAIVLPSECYENAPISLLEACALGKPIVASRIGGIPEMVRDGENGLVFESGNSMELAAALTEMARMSDDAVAAMGRRGRQLVETQHSPQSHLSRLLEVYAGG